MAELGESRELGESGDLGEVGESGDGTEATVCLFCVLPLSVVFAWSCVLQEREQACVCRSEKTKNTVGRDFEYG